MQESLCPVVLVCNTAKKLWHSQVVVHVLSQSHPCCNSIEVNLVMLGTNLSHSAFSVLPVHSAEILTASSKFEVMFIPGMWSCNSTDFNGLSVSVIPVR